jgi:hypothetical protein
MNLQAHARLPHPYRLRGQKTFKLYSRTLKPAAA